VVGGAHTNTLRVRRWIIIGVSVGGGVLVLVVAAILLYSYMRIKRGWGPVQVSAAQGCLLYCWRFGAHTNNGVLVCVLSLRSRLACCFQTRGPHGASLLDAPQGTKTPPCRFSPPTETASQRQRPPRSSWPPRTQAPTRRNQSRPKARWHATSTRPTPSLPSTHPSKLTRARVSRRPRLPIPRLPIPRLPTPRQRCRSRGWVA
jgi:hypothetical protein